MKFNQIFDSLNGMLGKVQFGLKKNAPQILMIGGGVGVAVGAVLACKATYSGLDPVLEEHNTTLKKVKKDKEEKKITDSEAGKKTAAVYAKTSLKIARLYAPSVGTITLSLVAMFTSHGIMKKRNAALATALSLSDTAFKKYRDRVVDRFGEEIDKQLLTGTHEEKVEETYTDENGKEKKRKKTINVADPNAESMYMKYFTRSNPYWENDPQYVEAFLRGKMKKFNSLLATKGFVTLNEVYRELGFEENQAGMVVGWLKNSPNKNADGQIEFTVTDVCIPNEYGEYENAYAIDFNVDGNIYLDICKRYGG